MKAGTVLIGRYYAVRSVSAALGLALMAAAAGAVVFMGLLWPAFWYHHTASAAAARWDVHVNGPLSRADVEALRSLAGEHGFDGGTQLANRGAIKRLDAGGRSIPDVGDLYALHPVGPPQFSLTWVSDRLVNRPEIGGFDPETRISGTIPPSR